MVREFISRYEETEQTILQRMLDRLPDEWRKEQGDYIYDAVATVPIEIQQLQIGQDSLLRSVFSYFAEDEELDEHLYNAGLTRIAATQSIRRLMVTAEPGVVIPAGYTVGVGVLDPNGDPLEFTVEEEVTILDDTPHTIFVRSVQAGTYTNIAQGATFILLPPIPGVNVITDDGISIPARDVETDEAARARLDNHLRFPDTGGNVYDYDRWSKEVEGVGAVRVLPRYQGLLQVKVVVVDNAYNPASPELVEDVQQYLDPGSQGLGEGKAPAGAKVIVEAANNVGIEISADVTYTQGADVVSIRVRVAEQLTAYLKSLTFVSDLIGYNKIGAIIGSQPEVVNFDNLLINGLTDDITLQPEDAPTLVGVTI